MYCKNIQILDLISKSSDPYVTVELLPKKCFKDNQIQKTSIVYKSLNPMFNEIFTL